MDNKRSTWMIVGVVVLVIVNVLSWGYVNYQLVTHGHMSEEFVVNWVAARALLIQGENPYDPEVTRTILTVLDTNSQIANWRVSQYTSPIYLIFLLLPFAMLADLTIAQTLWMSLSQVVLMLIILLSVNLAGIKPGRLAFVLLIVGTFLGYHGLAPILNGSSILIAGLFLLLSLIYIRDGRDEIAGIFLGLTTIQLPYLILPIVLILIWASSHRKHLVNLWFIGTMVFLSALGIFIVHDWLVYYLKIMVNFTLFFPASSPGAAFRVWWPGIGNMLSWALTIFSVVVLLLEWWLVVKRDIRWLLWTLCLTLVLGVWVGIPVVPDNLVLLVVPLILCVGIWSERWGKSGNLVAIVNIFLIFIWEWLIVYGNSGNVRQVDNLDVLFPMPIICLIGLYWIRWLVVRPKSLYIDDLRSSENV